MKHLAISLVLPVILLLTAACGGGSTPSADGDDDASADEELDLSETQEELPAIKPYECITDPACTDIMAACHRGDHREATDNSMAAFKRAIDLGVQFIEVDVRDTADEALVLMHDSDVSRTTNGTGTVTDMTLAQIEALTLRDCKDSDPDWCAVPTFTQALVLADEAGIMLYVDMKTGRGDLVLAAIQAGPYFHVALLYDDFDNLAPLYAQDNRLLLMPPVDSAEALDAMLAVVPGIPIVEAAGLSPNQELIDYIHAAGVKVQMDTMAYGDMKAMIGDYMGWKAFLEAPVNLMQTDMAHLLIPALTTWRTTGVFPDEGPGDL